MERRFTRRELARGVMPLLIGAAGAADAAAKPRVAVGAPADVRPPDLSFLRDAPPVNLPRAREQMARAEVDALCVTHPHNVFYLTGHWPQFDRMGVAQTAIAILPRDPARPPALVMHAFLWYYTHSDERPAGERLVFTYTAPAAGDSAGAALERAAAPAAGPADAVSGGDGAEPAALAPRPYRILEESLVTPRERGRRAALASAQGNAADVGWACVRALRALGLADARLAIDDPGLAMLLGARGSDARCVPGGNLLRWIRLAKSPVELRLMRLAAAANVDAALAAVRAARAAGDTRSLRATFFAEAARRGNAPVFMVVDQSSSEVMNAPLSEGQAFSIDCVSSCRFYHGDFARTVFVGEPNERMKRITSATLRAWRDIQAALRPGLPFAEIPRIGRESLRRQGADFNVSFTPHSVGLFHTDHPQRSAFEPQPLAPLLLEQDMILSVDCPLGDTGAGGSAHLEDLVWIGAEGAEPIHSVPANVLIV